VVVVVNTHSSRKFVLRAATFTKKKTEEKTRQKQRSKTDNIEELTGQFFTRFTEAVIGIMLCTVLFSSSSLAVFCYLSPALPQSVLPPHTPSLPLRPSINVSCLPQGLCEYSKHTICSNPPSLRQPEFSTAVGKFSEKSKGSTRHT
jgi:hypothetical protein